MYAVPHSLDDPSENDLLVIIELIKFEEGPEPQCKKVTLTEACDRQLSAHSAQLLYAANKAVFLSFRLKFPRAGAGQVQRVQLMFL